MSIIFLILRKMLCNGNLGVKVLMKRKQFANKQ